MKLVVDHAYVPTKSHNATFKLGQRRFIGLHEFSRNGGRNRHNTINQKLAFLLLRLDVLYSPGYFGAWIRERRDVHF